MMSAGDDGGCGKKCKVYVEQHRKKEDKEDDNWPDDPSWDRFPVPTELGNMTSEELLRQEIKSQFDPYLGSYSSSFQYKGSPLERENMKAYEAYSLAGHDLKLIAFQGLNNPMTDKDWLAADVDINLIYSRAGTSSHAPYQLFLEEMRLDPTNYNNYEANYLAAMMDAHPMDLDLAQEQYYDIVMTNFGNSEDALLWLQMSRELLGTE